MAEGGDSSVNFFKRHWQGWTGFYRDRFAFLESYSRFINRGEQLSAWSPSDVKDFIASDPVNGHALRTAREAAQFGLVGSAIGAVTSGAFAFKYSRSPHGAVLALGAGAVVGWTFGHEIANHWFQLYRVDTLTAQAKFMEWWEKKTES